MNHAWLLVRDKHRGAPDLRCRRFSGPGLHSMVVVVAFTGIASFIFPAYNAGMAIRIARFPMLILAGFLGYFGIMIGLIMLLVRLASMTSFGVPYLSPLAPTNQGDLSDTLVRRPWWAVRQRPQNISPDNRVRQE